MGKAKADLILHPVRMRIMRALINGPMTTQQLVETLPDVAQATVYRQTEKLLKAEFIRVVEERPVRGALEKVYALGSLAALNLAPQDLARASRDDHMRYFTTFLTMLMADFGRYLQRDPIDMLADGAGYRQVDLHLSEAEFQTVVASINAALLPYLGRTPAPELTSRTLTTILIPTSHEPKAQEN